MTEMKRLGTSRPLLDDMVQVVASNPTVPPAHAGRMGTVVSLDEFSAWLEFEDVRGGTATVRRQDVKVVYLRQD